MYYVRIFFVEHETKIYNVTSARYIMRSVTTEKLWQSHVLKMMSMCGEVTVTCDLLLLSFSFEQHPLLQLWIERWEEIDAMINEVRSQLPSSVLTWNLRKYIISNSSKISTPFYCITCQTQSTQKDKVVYVQTNTQHASCV